MKSTIIRRNFEQGSEAVQSFPRKFPVKRSSITPALAPTAMFMLSASCPSRQRQSLPKASLASQEDCFEILLVWEASSSTSPPSPSSTLSGAGFEQETDDGEGGTLVKGRQRDLLNSEPPVKLQREAIQPRRRQRETEKNSSSSSSPSSSSLSSSSLLDWFLLLALGRTISRHKLSPQWANNGLSSGGPSWSQWAHESFSCSYSSSSWAELSVSFNWSIALLVHRRTSYFSCSSIDQYYWFLRFTSSVHLQLFPHGR